MRKEAKKLAKLLEEKGLRVGIDGSGHYVVRDPKLDFRPVARFSQTPSDRRWRMRAVADLIRAGSLTEDPYKAGGKTMTSTAAAEPQSPIDLNAAQAAHLKRIAFVKGEIERLFAELGDATVKKSGIPTRFVAAASTIATERGYKHTPPSLMTALWQIRHGQRVGVGVLELFEQVIHNWDNGIGRPEVATGTANNTGTGVYQARNDQRKKAKRSSRTAGFDVVHAKRNEERAAVAAGTLTPFTCDECGKQFDNSHAVSVHKVSHRNETCAICGREMSLTAIGMHMRHHADLGQTAVAAEPAVKTETEQLAVAESKEARKRRAYLLVKDATQEELKLKSFRSKRRPDLFRRSVDTLIASKGESKMYDGTLDEIERLFGPPAPPRPEIEEPKQLRSSPSTSGGQIVDDYKADLVKLSETDNDAAIDAVLLLLSQAGNDPGTREAAKTLLKRLA